MPRNGSGVYSLPAGSTITNGDTSDASDLNTPLADIETDMNTVRPVVAGGTGASTAADARTALGLAIGTNVQAYNANLASLAGLTFAANKGLYTTGANTAALFDLTAAGLALLDDANAAAQRTTLGLVIGTNVQAYGATLTSLEALSLAQGDVLYATAADTLARLPKGTADQVLTMNAGATAPEWATPSSDRTLLATKTASTSATLDFTEFDNATYSVYEFELVDIIPANDGPLLQFNTSSNGGSSYDNAGGNYNYVYSGFNTAAVEQGASAAADPRVTGAVGSAANEFGVTGRLTLYSAADATRYTRLQGELTYTDNGGLHTIVKASGVRLSAADVDAIRFLFSSGTIESGTIRMYGIV